MVGLDRRRRAFNRNRFNNIRVQSSLDKETDFAVGCPLLQIAGRLVKDSDKFPTNALALFFRVSDALELGEEEKRKRIGREFIAVFDEAARNLQQGAAHGEIGFLVQGTLYPDVIESVSVKGPSATIKTHHNVGGLPEKMPFVLIEPLLDLFKDEVRRIGKELGLPEEILVKHPFPGPGLAVRLLGEITRPHLVTLQDADAIVVEEIRRAGLYNKVWQAFAVLLPVRSVGVMGDGRTYGLTVAVRVVESDDAMTADWVRLPGEVLERISTRIVNEVAGVTRVVYDISSKPPSTIEWE